MDSRWRKENQGNIVQDVFTSRCRSLRRIDHFICALKNYHRALSLTRWRVRNSPLNTKVLKYTFKYALIKNYYPCMFRLWSSLFVCHFRRFSLALIWDWWAWTARSWRFCATRATRRNKSTRGLYNLFATMEITFFVVFCWVTFWWIQFLRYCWMIWRPAWLRSFLPRWLLWCLVRFHRRRFAPDTGWPLVLGLYTLRRRLWS